MSNENLLRTVPPPALGVVLRHFSKRPKSSMWRSFIGPEEARRLLCDKTGLGSTFRSQTKSVRIVGPHEQPGLFALEPRGELFLRAGDGTACAALAAAGRHFTDVVVSSVDVRQSFFDRCMLLVARHCSELRALALGDINLAVFENLLIERGKALESFALDIQDPSAEKLNLVARYCTNVRHLSIQIRSYCPRELWREVGSGIVDLDITIAHGASKKLGASALNGVKKYCRALRKLDCSVGFQLHACVERLCASYGTQLNSARLYDILPRHVSVIADECPNVVFRISSTLNHIHAAQYRIHTFDPSPMVPLSSRELAEIGRYATSLRYFILEKRGVFTPEICADLLSPTMTQLELVALDLQSSNTDEVLHILADRTHTVRDLRLVCNTVPTCSAIHRFVVANKSIQRFELVSKFGRAEVVSKDSVNAVARIIRACAQAKRLRELFVLDVSAMRNQMFSDRTDWCETIIADACVPLRGHYIYINIFGVAYPV